MNILEIAVIGRANVGKSQLIKCIFDDKQFKTNQTPETINESDIKLVFSLANGSFAKIDFIVIDNKLDIDKQIRSNTFQSISMADFSIIVLDAREELYKSETELITLLHNSQSLFLVAVNKIEYGINPHLLSELDALEVTYFEVSCKENAGIESFRKKLIHMLPNKW